MPSQRVNEDVNEKVSLNEFTFDQSRQFKSLSFFSTGSKWKLWSDQTNVCLATQTSLDRLDELIPLAERWSGPLSVAIFTPGGDFQLARQFIHYLNQCHQSRVEMVKD